MSAIDIRMKAEPDYVIESMIKSHGHVKYITPSNDGADVTLMFRDGTSIQLKSHGSLSFHIDRKPDDDDVDWDVDHVSVQSTYPLDIGECTKSCAYFAVYDVPDSNIRFKLWQISTIESSI